MHVAYVDTSALVKLAVLEPESAALRAELVRWPYLATSVVGRIELERAMARALPAASDLVDAVLERVALVALDEPVRRVAATLRPPRTRTLDAIHVASALALGDRLGVVVAYDERLLEAARGARLPVVAPRA